jgi:peroxiredoxin
VDSSLPTPTRTNEGLRTPLKRFAAAIGLVFLLSIPVAMVTVLQRSEAVHRLRPGDHVPRLNLRSIDSTDVSTFGLNGRPAALLFFSVDCPRCQQEIANFETLYRTRRGKDLFAGIASGNEQETKKFFDRREFTLPIFLDDNEEVRKAFGVDEVPTLFLVRASGMIVYRSSGPVPIEALRRLLADFFDDERK